MRTNWNWLRQPRTWVELFALFNLAGLAPDIFLAHSTNHFQHGMEWVPLVFSLVAPLVLAPALWALAKEKMLLWHALGSLVGWVSVLVGIAGLVLHLQSQFFQQWTLASLVYTAPFAAPLAYTGIGLLLIMNRAVPAHSLEWAQWVIILALGGFVGNFVFSVTDHAQNGFFRPVEWIPIVSSALMVGFLIMPLVRRVGLGYLLLCTLLLGLQVLVGGLGFLLHFHADLTAESGNLFQRIVYGAPIFAPLLFPNLALLAGIGIWCLYFAEANYGKDAGSGE